MQNSTYFFVSLLFVKYITFEVEKKGLKNGIKQGIEKERNKNIILMFKEGIDLKTISKIINISIKDVEKIINNML